MRGQASFFIKAIVMIAAVLSFVAVVFFYQSFQASIMKEKEKSELRIEALDILQKLINKRENLAYVYNNITQKGVLDINKIIRFANTYSNTEPPSAKALNFDYQIEITEFPKNFSTYPGKKIEEGECSSESSEYRIAMHAGEYPYVFVCDGNLSKCCGGSELDGPFPRTLSCNVTCYPYNCSKFMGSEEECKFINSEEDAPRPICCEKNNCANNDHPLIVDCYNLNVTANCTLVDLSSIHAWCGLTMTYSLRTAGASANVTTSKKIWRFGTSAGLGVSSFSPPGAIKDKVEIVLPVTIRYNKTVARDGEIKIIAVRGELETLNSLIEDVCLKAEKNPREEIKVIRDLYFTYPVTYNGTHLKMLTGIKIPECNYPIVFENISRRGKYSVEIKYNPSLGKVIVNT